jgi:hypothetical protein
MYAQFSLSRLCPHSPSLSGKRTDITAPPSPGSVMTGGHSRLKQPANAASATTVTLHAAVDEDLARWAGTDFDFLAVDVANWAQMLPVANNRPISASILTQATPYRYGLCWHRGDAAANHAKVLLLLFDSTLRRLAKYITQDGRQSARVALSVVDAAERTALIARSRHAGNLRHLLRMPSDGNGPIRSAGPLAGPCKHAQTIIASSRDSTMEILKIAYMTHLVAVQCPPRGGILVGVGPEQSSTPGLDDAQVVVLLVSPPPDAATDADAIAFFGGIEQLAIGLSSGPVSVRLRRDGGKKPSPSVRARRRLHVRVPGTIDSGAGHL